MPYNRTQNTVKEEPEIMCRPKSEGGRRCYHGTEYERVLRNLKAKKQYHTRKGNTAAAEETSTQIINMTQAVHLADSLNTAKLYPHLIPLTENTEKLLTTLTDAGYTPYIVGGTVRDALTGEPIKDVDIEVYGAEPEQLTSTLKNLTQHVDEVGQQFGVLKVRIGEEEYDVSLPRKENRTGAAHTSFEVETDKDMSIQEASSRRDFTVNALLYSHQLGCIIDTQGGVEDWKQRTLKHVSDAFDEDPLRVLRGAQMAARFNMTLHPDTTRKAETLKDEFPNIAKERVQVEFQKLFTKSFHPDKGFQVIKNTGWDTNFPGLAAVNHETLISQLTDAGRTASKEELDDDSRAAFFGAVIASHITTQERRNFLSYITVGDKTKNIAYSLASTEPPENTDPATLRHWAKNVPNGVTFKSWLRVQKTVHPEQRQIWEQLEETTKTLNLWEQHEPELIKGDTLMAELGETRNGRWVGEALRQTKNAQYEGKFRTLQDGIKWVHANRTELLP